MAKKGNVTFCKKSVLVAVYVETPRRRRTLLPSTNHHHHHHHHHLHLHQANHHGGGRNRKAELLSYSRHLRLSAARPNNHEHKPLISYVQQPTNQIIDVQNKPKHTKGGAPQTRNWKLMIPRFLRSLTMSIGRKKKKRSSSTGSITTSLKAKAIMQSFQAKKKGFAAKFFAALHKYR